MCLSSNRSDASKLAQDDLEIGRILAQPDNDVVQKLALAQIVQLALASRSAIRSLAQHEFQQLALSTGHLDVASPAGSWQSRTSKLAAKLLARASCLEQQYSCQLAVRASHLEGQPQLPKSAYTREPWRAQGTSPMFYHLCCLVMQADHVFQSMLMAIRWHALN